MGLVLLAAGLSRSAHHQNFLTMRGLMETLCQFRSCWGPYSVALHLFVSRLERGAGNFYIIKVPEKRVGLINLQEKSDLKALLVVEMDRVIQ